jgi:hypothetical protein
MGGFRPAAGCGAAKDFCVPGTEDFTECDMKSLNQLFVMDTS